MRALRWRQRMRRHRDEQGAGLLASAWSVLAFFVFMFLAVQIGVNLYATSTISAVGFDAARRAAAGGGTRAAVSEADGWLRASLGPSLTLHDIRWESGGDSVQVSIDAQPPSLMVDTNSALGSRRIRRSFVVRTERSSQR